MGSPSTMRLAYAKDIAIGRTPTLSYLMALSLSASAYKVSSTTLGNVRKIADWLTSTHNWLKDLSLNASVLMDLLIITRQASVKMTAADWIPTLNS